MSWFEGIILGLIQGLTEFLPVSSSGHLMIGRELLGIDLPDGESFLSFEIIVHAATVLATIVVFRRQIADLIKGLFKFQYNGQTAYILKIGVSMIPVFIVGIFFKEQVSELFDGLLVVGIALLVTSVLLYLSDIYGPRIQQARSKGEGISYWQALVVGLAQAVAVIPGLSRSGTTIAVGLLSGVKRSEVAQFSFLMVLIPILGEAFLDMMDGGFAESAATLGAAPLILGFLTAFFSGLMACRAMVSLVKKSSLKWFAIYCAVVGTATLIALAIA